MLVGVNVSVGVDVLVGVLVGVDVGASGLYSESGGVKSLVQRAIPFEILNSSSQPLKSPPLSKDLPILPVCVVILYELDKVVVSAVPFIYTFQVVPLRTSARWYQVSVVRTVLNT